MKIADPLFSAIEIEINHSCNRRCSYCPNSVTKRKSTGEIDPDLFAKILAELRALDYRGRVSYHFFNEPLLHSDLESVVAQTRAALPAAFIEIYTNGTLLSRERFTSLREAGTDRFTVTRHEGMTKYLFDSVFESLSSGERECVHFRPISDVRLTNRGGTLPHLGADGVALTPCHIPSLCMTVTVDGKALACFEDYNETLTMGDLKTSTITDIWNSEAYTRFRATLRRGLRHEHKICSQCNRTEALPPPSAPRGETP